MSSTGCSNSAVYYQPVSNLTTSAASFIPLTCIGRRTAPLTQLYNEEVNDLLAPASLKLPIHESKESGVYVAGLREDIVTSAEQVLALLDEGEANRHIGATRMNEGSSRSHTVFRMVRSKTAS